MEGTILITGSNGGIGKGVAQFLLEKGHRNIVCHYRSCNDEIAKVLQSFDLSPDKHTVKASLTKEEDVIAMKNTILENHPQVSALVNIAGASTNSMSWKLTLQDFMSVINDNLTSTFLTCKTFIPEMRDNNFGRIINTSSVVGYTGVAGASHYSAAKAGISAFTKSIALELCNKNITVNSLALGYINAGIIKEVPSEIQDVIKSRIPAKRFGDVAEIASFIEYLLSKDASYITGQVHHLNGGLY